MPPTSPARSAGAFAPTGSAPAPAPASAHALAELALLACSLAIVIGIRAQLLLATDFPINDGALFLAFVEAIAHTFPHLPASVDYNGFAIPFAYPPLAFWLSAGAVRLGADPLQLVHQAPILMNMGWVLLFALLLLRTGHSRLFTALAVLVFGTTFRSYEWLVMGGGLSRGLGSLFLLATLLVLLPAAMGRTRWTWRQPVLGGLCVGATILSHLEWGILCTLSAVLAVALARRGFLAFVRDCVLMGLVSLLLVAPWFATVVQAHGLAPFSAASKTSAWTFRVIPEGGRMVTRTSFTLLPFVLLGTVLVCRSRDVFWLLFLLLAVIVTPRSGETPMVLGLGVLAATGLMATGRWVARRTSPRARYALPALVALGAVLVGARAIDAMRRDENFVALSPQVRQAMAWVAQQHPGERFAVLREAPWYYNAAAEWFPVLAHAVSTTTLQGREWLPNEEFGHTYEALEELNESTNCVALKRAMDAFPLPQFVWVEGVDLRARAVAVARTKNPNPVQDRMQNWKRRLAGAPLIDRGEGVRALRGGQSLAGCFDAAGWREVHANARVRIFEAPTTATPSTSTSGLTPAPVR